MLPVLGVSEVPSTGAVPSLGSALSLDVSDSVRGAEEVLSLLAVEGVCVEVPLPVDCAPVLLGETPGPGATGAVVTLGVELMTVAGPPSDSELQPKMPIDPTSHAVVESLLFDVRARWLIRFMRLPAYILRSVEL